MLYTFDGDYSLDLFGISVSGAGDLDNNGLADLIVGAYQNDNNGNNSGSARIILAADLMNDPDLDFRSYLLPL